MPALRPTWMVLLSSLMAMVAFQQFMGGLSELAGEPLVTPPQAAGEAALPSPQDAAQLAVGLAFRAALEERPAPVSRLLALMKLAYAAGMLFAVVAIATRDRKGRVATMAAAWAGIAYHLASLWVFQAFVRPAMLRRAPEWLDQVRAAVAAGGGDQSVSLEMIDAWAQNFLLAFPSFLASLGIAFGLLLLVFFGGRRGRAYYGLAPVAARDPARTRA